MKLLEAPPPLVRQQSRVRSDNVASPHVANKPLTTQLRFSPVADSHRWVPEAVYLGIWAMMAECAAAEAGDNSVVANPITLGNNVTIRTIPATVRFGVFMVFTC